MPTNFHVADETQMTWTKNGVKGQGFSSPPNYDFTVPYHGTDPITNFGGEGNTADEQVLAASGVLGKFHTERGLTLVTVVQSGHMIPQYAPTAAYRQLQFLLGRIPSLNATTPFHTIY